MNTMCCSILGRVEGIPNFGMLARLYSQVLHLAVDFLKSLAEPATLAGFLGDKGFGSRDATSVAVCLCDTRDPHQVGGASQYLFQHLGGLLSTAYHLYLCYGGPPLLYPTDESPSIKFGQGDLVVTESRGYVRNGSFEGIPGTSAPVPAELRQMVGYFSSGDLDASIFNYTPCERSGHSVGLLGLGDGGDFYERLPDPTLPTEEVCIYQQGLEGTLQSSIDACLGLVVEYSYTVNICTREDMGRATVVPVGIWNPLDPNPMICRSSLHLWMLKLRRARLSLAHTVIGHLRLY
ncbi:hypothetical protein BT96DRAFT_978945 [Gymnopus androsaceus JB14]|uniref:Uncharacterized protein n=1 Tax=Gymnopus androsaceus JB14 TaxID=1447944 RepID=A0A6A4H8A7_9AGAR|nr:hypothetical protein BT96DRAFT_978945 [Gymnopus androsaceus JB14]